MTIRKATYKDVELLTELFDLYRVFYKQASDPNAAASFLQARFHNNDSVIFIAFEKDDPVGFVQLFPSFSSVSMQRIWILNDLYVRKEARKKGVAKQLMRQAISYADETDAKGILLETAEDNAPAQRLYEQIGFQRETNYFYFFSV